jgi:hypothetical protein
MLDIGPVTKDITDKVNILTLQNDQDQKSDWGTAVETVLSGGTLTVIKPIPLPSRGSRC